MFWFTTGAIGGDDKGDEGGGGGGGDGGMTEEEKEIEEARREAEEKRKEKHRKMEEEREEVRQSIRDKVLCIYCVSQRHIRYMNRYLYLYLLRNQRFHHIMHYLRQIHGYEKTFCQANQTHSVAATILWSIP